VALTLFLQFSFKSSSSFFFATMPYKQLGKPQVIEKSQNWINLGEQKLTQLKQ